MKTRNFQIKTQGRRHEGGTLVVTLLTMSVISLVAASYLSLISSTNTSTIRSMAWNNAVPVLEAGIEEAMAHLNKNGSGSLAVDGWSAASGGYVKSFQIGTNGSYVSTTITPSGTTPVIESKGYVRVPLKTSTYVTRTVRVNTKRDALYSKGLVAKGQINLNGNNIRVDSFDSQDSAYSTNGQYDAAKYKENGDVATNSQLVNSLNVGNADIYGNVSTGPGGSVAVGSQGFVTGTVSDDMNVSFPDVTAPTGSMSTPASGTVNGTSYTYVLSSGTYVINGDLSLSGNNQRILVTGEAVLYVTGNVTMSGQSYIQVGSSGSLKMYVAGASSSIGGQGVMNSTGNASKFAYYGLPTNTSVSFSGNAAFTGTIYAPSAALTLGGGGNNTYDFVGSAIASTATMNGHYNFHYDEMLGRTGASRGYVATSWNEL